MRNFWTFVAVLGCVGLTGPGAWKTCSAGLPQGGAAFHLVVKDLGPLGTGSNMFRTGLVHSSGAVFVGTYGPAPARVWKYDPRSGELTKVGAPGEYQLTSMVEAPNGNVYIGTAYNAIVYELDPATGRIRSLGSPPVTSTPWIFTMIRTRDGEIYGAKGVGLFRLDWRTGKMEELGLVPGDHATPGPAASNPIVRTLEERPDGTLWGDTNRWVFTFDPQTRKITPVADVLSYDEACYAVLHAEGPAPVADLYFSVHARFSGKTPGRPFGICRANTGRIEPLQIAGLSGKCTPCGWWQQDGQPRWLVADYAPGEGESSIAVVDVARRRVVDRWQLPGREMPPARLAGPGLWFISSARGTLYRAEPEKKLLVRVAVNPEPAECRCLAASPAGRLAAYTYDCGFAFTLDPKTGQAVDLGRVEFDDHRCVFGPAAFAGPDGRHLLANHGDTLPRLWVSDLQASRHEPLGETAIQLVRAGDGTVWGRQGALPRGDLEFAPGRSWTPARAAARGKLFRYRPEEQRIEVMPGLGPVGVMAPVPGRLERVLVGLDKAVGAYDVGQERVVARAELPSELAAAVTDASAVYLVLADASLLSATVAADGTLTTKRLAADFGPVDRGCFLLPQSRCLVAVAGDGSVKRFDPRSGTIDRVRGPVPPGAGPAVHPTEDVWYFAGRRVLRYALARSAPDAPDGARLRTGQRDPGFGSPD